MFLERNPKITKLGKFEYLLYITKSMKSFWAMVWKDFKINRQLTIALIIGNIRLTSLTFKNVILLNCSETFLWNFYFLQSFYGSQLPRRSYTKCSRCIPDLPTIKSLWSSNKQFTKFDKLAIRNSLQRK